MLRLLMAVLCGVPWHVALAADEGAPTDGDSGSSDMPAALEWALQNPKLAFFALIGVWIVLKWIKRSATGMTDPMKVGERSVQDARGKFNKPIE